MAAIRPEPPPPLAHVISAERNLSSVTLLQEVRSLARTRGATHQRWLCPVGSPRRRPVGSPWQRSGLLFEARWRCVRVSGQLCQQPSPYLPVCRHVRLPRLPQHLGRARPARCSTYFTSECEHRGQNPTTFKEHLRKRTFYSGDIFPSSTPLSLPI